MVFSASITTPSNTVKDNPKKTVLSITKGLIYRIEVEFPPGPRGLLHVQIYDGSYQLFPATPGDSFYSDECIIGFDDLYLKQSAPYNLMVYTWNIDDVYDHGLQVRVGVAHTEAFMSRYMPSISWEKFAGVMAKTMKEQEKIKQAVIEAAMKEVSESIS